MQGNERHPDFDYPDDEYRYFAFADRFGWTPNQVDEQPGYLLDWMLAIAALNEEVKAEKLDG